ncbi:MAG: hypothetical protein EBZ77_14315 [Chitinophagia bacterium]|nr:hypothetical protein [Chitinophagia bacterium]
MKTYLLARTQLLPISIAEAWAFFSVPDNLSKITPSDMGFTIVSQLDGKPTYTGMLIEYRVKPLLGIPMKWITKIGAVEAPRLFVDTQLVGPYALWEHTHTFKETPEGTLMTDEVKYALPLGILGEFAHMIFVKKRLEHIFDYRYKVLEQLFAKK